MAYTTTHTEAEHTMKHEFDNGYTVIVHWKLNRAFKILGFKTDNFSIEGLSPEEFHNILLNIDKEKV